MQDLMSFVNLGMFHHYRPTRPPVQKSHWEQMDYGKDLISSLTFDYQPKLFQNITQRTKF